MNEQATIEQPTASAAAPAILLPSETRGNGDVPSNRQRRPNRGMSHWGKKQNAITRIPQLLAQLKAEKQKREQDRIEAQSALKLADEEIERLKSELLAVLAENDDFRSREESRLFSAEEDRKAEMQERDEYLVSVLRAAMDAATQSGVDKRHRDFASRLKRADHFAVCKVPETFYVPVLESAFYFGPETGAELIYLLASDASSYRKLMGLPPVEIYQRLSPTATAISDKLKLERLVR